MHITGPAQAYFMIVLGPLKGPAVEHSMHSTGPAQAYPAPYECSMGFIAVPYGLLIETYIGGAV